jgi:hypothetical protein
MRCSTPNGSIVAGNECIPYPASSARCRMAPRSPRGATPTPSRMAAYRWSEHGYATACAIPRADGLLTPPSTLLAIRAGYRPELHPAIATS